MVQPATRASPGSFSTGRSTIAEYGTRSFGSFTPASYLAIQVGDKCRVEKEPLQRDAGRSLHRTGKAKRRALVAFDPGGRAVAEFGLEGEPCHGENVGRRDLRPGAAHLEAQRDGLRGIGRGAHTLLLQRAAQRNDRG